MGQYRSAFRGTGLVFSDLREYQPGDDVKHIHWRATARTNKVYVKSYEEERQLKVIVAIDTSASTRWGSPRTRYSKAVEFSALLVSLAQRSGDAIGLACFGDSLSSFIPPSASRSHYHRVTSDLLKSRQLERSTDLGPVLESLRIRSPRSAVIFVISDFYSPPFVEPLRRLAGSHDLILVSSESLSIAEDLPDVGIVSFTDAESGGECTVDLGDPRVRRTIHELSVARYEELRAICRRCGTDLMKLENNPVRALARLMEQRKISGRGSTQAPAEVIER